jgi:hypothetical protein
MGIMSPVSHDAVVRPKEHAVAKVDRDMARIKDLGGSVRCPLA